MTEPKLDGVLSYWTPDEVSECLELSDATRARLWDLLEDPAWEPPVSHDDIREHGEFWWPRLTPAQRAEVAAAYAAYDAKLEELYRKACGRD